MDEEPVTNPLTPPKQATLSEVRQSWQAQLPFLNWVGDKVI